MLCLKFYVSAYKVSLYATYNNFKYYYNYYNPLEQAFLCT